MEIQKKEFAVCNECGSLFFKGSSQMMALCPECAHILYGYPNCPHHFQNGRCGESSWRSIAKSMPYSMAPFSPCRSTRQPGNSSPSFFIFSSILLTECILSLSIYAPPKKSPSAMVSIYSARSSSGKNANRFSRRISSK